MVALDDELLEQIDGARRMRDGEPQREQAAPVRRSHAESALSPREIQARLRKGRTVAEVAVEAGVEMEWIERFAAPVLAEQAAAVAKAGGMTLRTTRRGMSDRPLHQSVLRNLADRGIRMTDEELASAWSANQIVNGEWLVRFTFAARGGRYQAEWTLDIPEGALIPRNRMGTELGFVDPVRHAALVRDLTGPVTRMAALAAEAEDLGAAEGARAPRRTRQVTTKRPAATPPKRAVAATKSAPVKKRETAKKSAPVKKRETAKKAAPVQKRAAVKKAEVPTKRAAQRTGGAVRTAAAAGTNGARRRQPPPARPRPLPEPALLAELVREVERPLKRAGDSGKSVKRPTIHAERATKRLSSTAEAPHLGANNHQNGT
jgi:hypothetical protein